MRQIEEETANAIAAPRLFNVFNQTGRSSEKGRVSLTLDNETLLNIKIVLKIKLLL